jgi:hypothetical protein
MCKYATIFHLDMKTALLYSRVQKGHVREEFKMRVKGPSSGGGVKMSLRKGTFRRGAQN